ncbi:dienelactone hydrolase family protein [Micromonospora sp. NPDC051925]|uniref:dienelactone hydrolase family protein n=1 Tax=Micromonospora sp. NPDC051925 TaxID=3364288 RepID=UPI0037CCA492
MNGTIAEQPFVLSPPSAPVERHGRVDLHLPAGDGSHPAVVLVHGAPLPPGTADPRDWLLYQGYGALLAEQGLVAAALSYQVTDLAELPATADDIAALVELVRADPRVDAERVVLWFFSGGSLLAADWLRAAPPWLRGIALTYPLLVPLPGGEVDPRFLPVGALDGGGTTPVVLTRAGRDKIPQVLTGIADFLDAAARTGRAVRVVDVPDGQHAFDILDHTAQSREAVQTARDAVVDLLRAT